VCSESAIKDGELAALRNQEIQHGKAPRCDLLQKTPKQTTVATCNLRLATCDQRPVIVQIKGSDIQMFRVLATVLSVQVILGYKRMSRLENRKQGFKFGAFR